MAPLEAALAEAGDFRRKHGRPLVTLSYAQSLDGSLSASRQESTAISGPQSLKITHQLRAAHDAILVGIGTVLADDPRLNVRLAPGEDPQPLLLDSRLRIPPNSQLLQKEPRPWIFCSAAAPEDKQAELEALGARVERQAGAQGRVDLAAMLSTLAAWGVDSLMVEGGAAVISSFLAARLVDLVLITIAPAFIGGVRALESSLGADFPRIEAPQYEQVGDDVLVWGALES